MLEAACSLFICACKLTRCDRWGLQVLSDLYMTLAVNTQDNLSMAAVSCLSRQQYQQQLVVSGSQQRHGKLQTTNATQARYVHWQLAFHIGCKTQMLHMHRTTPGLQWLHAAGLQPQQLGLGPSSQPTYGLFSDCLMVVL